MEVIPCKLLTLLTLLIMVTLITLITLRMRILLLSVLNMRISWIKY